ncbi:MAG: C45 family autoproteolytic acyltransferase/hydrolase [Anaerolineae bacterium]|jgi:predicted choloylglycine hydrolase
MHQVEVAGSYYELGLNYGRVVAENKLNSWWQQPTEPKIGFVRACEREIAAHAPGLLEEMRGIADACECEYDLVLANMTLGYWELSACNVIAVSGSQCRNGKTIFARNHDWLDEDQEHVTCFRTHASTGIPHIGFGFADVGRYGGVNEEGLAVSSAAIWYQNQPKPGLRFHLATRWVLDTYSNTRDAVDYLKRVPHHEAVSFLIADKEGRLARVEVAPEGVDAVSANDGMLSAINMFQSDKMQYLERIAEEGYIVYRHRARIAAWYDDQKGQIDLDAAKRLCSDHEIGLCDHGETRSEPFGTIYSWVAELGTGKMYVAHGRPCENEYRAIGFEMS